MVTREQALAASSPLLAVVVGQALLSGLTAPGASVLTRGDALLHRLFEGSPARVRGLGRTQ
ncbi:MAG TPA: hypothetical protein VHO29_02740 [Marmoricola sp.]|nr:hypothetical protein [Marmoricola sp.]